PRSGNYVAAECRTAELNQVIIGTTASDPFGSLLRTARISNGIRCIGTVPIAAPFKDIAMHVVQAKWIRLSLACIMRTNAVVAEPAVLRQCSVVKRERKGSHRPGPACVFP